MSNTSSVLPGAIELVTKSADGQGVYAEHIFPSMAEDGSFVFVSKATNLVTPPTNAREYRYYFYDNPTKKLTVLPSLLPDIYLIQSITPDKAWIFLPAYLYNTSTGEFTTVAKADGTLLDAAAAEVSGDGSVVAITTLKKLVPEDTNTKYDLYLWHRATKEVQFIPTTSSVNGIERDFTLSDDGQFVAYVVRGSSSLPCGRQADDIYRKNVITGEVICLTLGVDDSDGEYFNSPQMSADGSLSLVNGIIYVGVNPQLNGAYLINVNGGTTTTLFTKSESSSMGSYRLTADGKFVQYMKLNSITRQLAELCTYEVATATHSCITKPADIYDGYVHTISPTGRYSVIASWDHSWIGSVADNFNPVNQGRPNDLFIWDREGVNNAISGKVTGDDGVTGLANVTLTNGSREKYLTDASGTYSMPYLNAGQTYEVTPSLFGKTFYPAKKLVTVPTNGSVDFSTKNQVTVVSSGFDPKVHGWEFINSKAYSSWDAFKATYGPEVVEWKWNSISFKREDAKDYFEESYSKLGEIGMCYGMVTIATHRFTNSIALPEALATSQKLYDIEEPSGSIINTEYWRTGDVTNFIYEYHGYQVAREQLAAYLISLTRNLTDTVGLLQQSVDSKLQIPYGIGMFGKDNGTDDCIGHIVLPYAYTQSDDFIVFSVYDPNHPGEEGKVAINPEVDFWEFLSKTGKEWGSQYNCQGDNSRSVPNVLLSVTLGFDSSQAVRPWTTEAVGAANSDAVNIRQLYMSETFTATIQGGNPVFHIPYGLLPGDERAGITNKLYSLDTGVPFTVTLHPKQTTETSLSLFDSQTIVSISGQATQGVTDVITFNDTTDSLAITTGLASQRSVSTMTGDDAQQYRTDLRDIQLNGKTQAAFMIGYTGVVTLTLGTDQPSGYQAHFVQAGINGTSEFTLTMPMLAAVDTHVLQPNWTDNSVLVQTDQGSDGDIDIFETIKLNTEQRLFLPLVNR